MEFARTADFVGAGVLAGLTLLGGAASAGAENSNPDTALAALAIGAAVLLVSGLYGDHNVDRCHDERVVEQRREDMAAEAQAAARRRARSAADDRLAAREKAWALTQQAESAARATDCMTVAKLDVEIAAIDQGVHDDVFARDAAVIRCRTAAP